MLPTSKIMNWAKENPLRRLFSKFAPKGGLAHAMFALGGATLISQAVGVLLSPVYSRLYTPADYGVLSVYSSIVAMALTVGSLCYEQGIPISKDDTEAIGLIALATLIVFLIGMGVVVWLVLGVLYRFGGASSQLRDYFWLVPIGIVGAGVYQVVNYWALRRKAIGAIAHASVSQAIGSNTISLGFGILHPNPLGLVLAGIAGCSTGMWGLARRTKLVPQLQSERRKGLTPGQLWILAKKYKRLALVQAPSALFNSLGIYLPGMLAVPFFGADFAGQFFMGLKVIALPAGLIGGALNKAFYSSAAAVARERPQDLARYFHRVFSRGAVCSLPILVVGLAAPSVIPFALGAKWRVAGELTSWLSLYNVIGMSVSALSSIPNVVGRFRGQFIIDVLRAIAVFLLFYFCHRVGFSGTALVKGYTLVMIINYTACYMLYRHQVKLVSCTRQTGWSRPAANP